MQGMMDGITGGGMMWGMGLFWLLGLVVLVVAGVFTVAARSDTTTSTCPSMGHGGHGAMMGGGFGNGMMAGVDDDTMMADTAKVLRLDTTALVTQLHSGQTLTDIAKTQNVDVQKVYDAMLATAKEHMAAQVTAGTITALCRWTRGNAPVVWNGAFSRSASWTRPRFTSSAAIAT